MGARFRLRVATGGEEGGEDSSGKGASEDGGRCGTVESGWDGNGCSCGAGGAAVSLD
jgi:hypothetical protein